MTSLDRRSPSTPEMALFRHFVVEMTPCPGAINGSPVMLDEALSTTPDFKNGFPDARSGSHPQPHHLMTDYVSSAGNEPSLQTLNVYPSCFPNGSLSPFHKQLSSILMNTQLLLGEK
jgi:hypothetical protein